MELTRQEYPALVSSLEPDQAITVLNDRITLINRINGDIADWLQERRRIEETYAAALHKLAKRPQQDGAASLGVFQMPWQRIVSGVENMAQSHETLAAKIETDIETPLRQYATKNREMQSMGNVQGNLASIAKDLTSAQKKADKLNAKGSNRTDDARSSVDDASSMWQSQAPFVFEQLQALDEGRTNHLRDVLTQLQTHELDQTERHRASAESCLNALLNVETADEIKTFAARIKESRGMASRRRGDSTTAAATSDNSRPMSSHLPPAPPPPRNTNNEQRSASIPNTDQLGPLPDSTPQKSKISGLKRLGTVMSRRKGSAPPPPPSAAEKERKKEKSRSFAAFRRGDSSRSFQDLENSGRDLTPVASRDGGASSRHELETASQDNRLIDTTSNNAVVNGTAASAVTASVLAESRAQPASSQQPFLPELTSQPPLSYPTQETTLSPESIVRPDPFTQMSADSTLDESSRNLKIRDQPIQEDESEAQLAMNNMANQLRMQAQSSGMGRVQGSVRGRRDVRNTMFIPNDMSLGDNTMNSKPNVGGMSAPESAISSPMVASTVGPAADLATPVKRSTGVIPEDHVASSDSQSVHSAHSLGSIAHHPDLYLPGLNASIVETVSTWFGDGEVTRSSVVGEVALAYSPLSGGQTAEHETVRLQNFQLLEKCAQNPTFVNAVHNTGNTEDQAGTYNVSLASIKRPSPTIAFKYQLHLDESNLGQYSPLLLTSAWQIVEGQARAIVMYSLNPAFQLASSAQEMVLRNVVLSVNLDTKAEGAGKPTAAMMSPTQGASFKKRAGSVVWKLPELTVKATQERVLVSFSIEGGLAQKGGIEVKFEMPDVSASKLGLERMGTVEADPFADEDERKSAEQQNRWEELPIRRMLISGKYSAT